MLVELVAQPHCLNCLYYFRAIKYFYTIYTTYCVSGNVHQTLNAKIAIEVKVLFSEGWSNFRG